MKYFLFSLLVLTGCSNAYQSLQPSTVDAACIEKIKPHRMGSTWFHASIDVVGKHLSGLLLIKPTDDHTYRIVFTNEAGFTFFDFEAKTDGSFTVKKVIPQLDKKPVINTLRKDFDLLTGIPFHHAAMKSWSNDSLQYIGVDKGKERYFMVTDKQCNALKRLELGSHRKVKLTETSTAENFNDPQNVVIRHRTFDMTITLTKMERDVKQ